MLCTPSFKVASAAQTVMCRMLGKMGFLLPDFNSQINVKHLLVIGVANQYLDYLRYLLLMK